MSKAKSFKKRKLITGLIASRPEVFHRTEDELQNLFGPIDTESSFFDFNYTDYYSKQMGGVPLNRKFLSFEELIKPERLSEIKITMNHLENKIKKSLHSPHRIVNIDPGILNSSSLIMATVKDFAHRIPLRDGIYGHLELLFGKNDIRNLDWTYPDFKKGIYHSFFWKVRKKYIEQLR